MGFSDSVRSFRKVAVAALCLAMTLGAGWSCAKAKTGAVKPPSKNDGRSETVVPTPRTREDWMPRHEALVKRAEKGGIDVLFVGDSITEAMNRRLMDEIIGSKSDNFGIGGDRTAHLLWRLENGELKFSDPQPKVVVLLIGTNDMYEWRDDQAPALPAASNAETLKGIKANIAEIRRALPNAKLLVLGVLPREESAKHPIRGRIKRLNAELKSVADHRHVFFADIGAQMLEKDGTLSKDVMPDFLHPSAQVGYGKMFKAIKAQIEAIPGSP